MAMKSRPVRWLTPETRCAKPEDRSGTRPPRPARFENLQGLGNCRDGLHLIPYCAELGSWRLRASKGGAASSVGSLRRTKQWKC